MNIDLILSVATLLLLGIYFLRIQRQRREMETLRQTVCELNQLQYQAIRDVRSELFSFEVVCLLWFVLLAALIYRFTRT